MRGKLIDPVRRYRFLTKELIILPTDGKASVGLGVQVVTFMVDDQLWGDGVWLNVASTANTREDVDYTLYDSSYAYSWVEITDPIGSVSGDVDTFLIDWCAGSSDPISFYGGPGSLSDSGKYYYLYGCRNGWLWFDYKYLEETLYIHMTIIQKAFQTPLSQTAS